MLVWAFSISRDHGTGGTFRPEYVGVLSYTRQVYQTGGTTWSKCDGAHRPSLYP